MPEAHYKYILFAQANSICLTVCLQTYFNTIAYPISHAILLLQRSIMIKARTEMNLLFDDLDALLQSKAYNNVFDVFNTN